MKLKLIPGETLIDPTPEQIGTALERVYSGEITAAILSVNPENPPFLQVSLIGYMEYMEEDGGALYAAEDVPLEKCAEAFLDYAGEGSRWKDGFPWEAVSIERKRKRKTPEKEKKSASKYIPVHPEAKWNTRWLIITTILGVALACSACVYLTYLSKNLETAGTNRLLAEIIFNTVWLSLAGIIWAILRLNPLLHKYFIALSFGLVIVLAATEMWLSVYALGFPNVASFVALALGAGLCWVLIKALRLALEFERDSIEIPASHLRFERKLSNHPDYGVSEYTALSYVFLDQYSHSANLTGRQEKAYRSAAAEKRLRVFVRYMPRDPKIHKMRVEG